VTPPISEPYAAYVLGLLFVVYVFNFIDRQILAILLEAIKQDLGASDTAMGFLSGFAFALFYTVAGIPVARWADRGSRRTIIGLELGVLVPGASPIVTTGRSMMGGRREVVAGVVAAGVVLALGATVMLPASADAALVIWEKKGRFKIRQDACKGKEVAVDAADLGVAGPPGDQGDPGPPGAAGLSGIEVVTADGKVITVNPGISNATASCSDGKVVLGGGVAMGNLFGSINSQRVRTSAPVTTSPQGWFGELEADVTDDWQPRVFAICGTAAP
jgi:hypothetical protein